MTKTWKQKIGKRLLKHLTDMNITTLAQFKHNIKFQHDNDVPCHECTKIALKLGIKS